MALVLDPLQKLRELHEKQPDQVNLVTIILFSIGRSTAAQAQLWNEALEFETYGFLVAIVFAWIGHFCVALCLSEMASALPFTGGTYGFIRGLQGPYFGYLTGATELTINLANSALSMSGFGRSMAILTHLSPNYEPIFWLIPITLLIGCKLYQRTSFWNLCLGLSGVGIVFILLFIISAANTPHSSMFIDDNFDKNSAEYVADFFRALPYQSYMFIGIEILPVVAHKAKQPRQAIPFALMINTLYLLISTIVVVCLVTTMYPGTDIMSSVHTVPLTLSYGYSLGLHTSMSTAAIFSAVLMLTSFLCESFILIHITSSMADSKLLPRFLNYSWQLNNDQPVVPIAVIIFVLSQQLVFTVFYYLTFRFAYDYFIRLNALGSLGLYAIYFIILMTFLKFKRSFQGLQRSFMNPLGEYSAYLGSFIFLVVTVGVFVRFGPVLLPFLFIWMMMVYGLYKLEVEKLQGFTAEEEKVFMQTYIINANRNKRGAATASGGGGGGGGNKRNSIIRSLLWLMYCNKSNNNNNNNDSSSTSHHSHNHNNDNNSEGSNSVNNSVNNLRLGFNLHSHHHNSHLNNGNHSNSKDGSSSSSSSSSSSGPHNNNSRASLRKVVPIVESTVEESVKEVITSTAESDGKNDEVEDHHHHNNSSSS